MRRMLAAALAAAVSVTGVSALAPPSATADGTKDVGLTGFADIVVDPAHGHVFISQGNDRVVVTDGGGAVVTVLDGLYGAAGMTLADDGSTLWVALSKGDGIAALDTATLDRTVYPTGPDVCPDQLATSAGIVWFTGGCDGGQLGALDPADGSVDRAVLDGGATLLAASPADPGSLFALQPNSAGSDLVALDAVGGEAPGLTVRARRDVGYGTDLAVTPDGARVIVPAGQEHPVYRATDLSAMGAYESGWAPNAVAVRADGMVAAGVSDWYDTDVFVYRPDSSALYRSYELGGPSNTLEYRGLAFGPVKLYAVVSDTGDGDYRLRVITPRRATQLSLETDGDQFRYGAGVPVNVRLTGAGPGGGQVSVYASTAQGPERLVAQGPVDDHGRFSASVPVRQRTTFRATFEGTSDADPAKSRPATVLVDAKVTPTMQRYRDRSGKYYLYGMHSRAWMRAQVAPNHAGDCVYVVVQYRVRGSWGHGGRTKCLTLDARSRAGVYMNGSPELVGIPIRMRADWRGDKQNTGTESAWRYLRFKR